LNIHFSTKRKKKVGWIFSWSRFCSSA